MIRSRACQDGRRNRTAIEDLEHVSERTSTTATVVHVSTGLRIGGMEKLLVEFARHTDRDTLKPYFVALQERGPLAEDLESLGAEVFVLNKADGYRPFLTIRLARLFRRLRADIVHSHNIGAYLYAVPAARLGRVPVVMHTSHGRRDLESKRRNLAFVLASRVVNRLVCVSEDVRRRCTAEGIPEVKTRTIWNGIDTTRFSYSGPCKGGPAVIVARLSPEKDIATLIRALKIVVARYPDFRLAVVGDGECRSSLEQLTESLGLRGQVSFLGEVRDVAERLKRASMFVLSSISEGVSLTLLEAMAVGLPVVATDVGGNPEVVVPGETGWLVPARSPGQLAEAMMRVLAAPDRAHQIGRAGRRRVETHFDVRRMVRDYEDLYLTCLGRRRDSRRPENALESGAIRQSCHTGR